MKSVFILHHVHEMIEKSEDVKLISVYSSQKKAGNEVKRISEKPGFQDTPEGIHVNEYKLDIDHWTEGYATTVFHL